MDLSHGKPSNEMTGGIFGSPTPQETIDSSLPQTAVRQRKKMASKSLKWSS